MRRVLAVLALAAFAIAGSGVPADVLAQSTFEGEVTMTMAMPGMDQSFEMKYFVKGNKMRNEMSMMGMQMTQIVDMDAGTMMMLMPAQRAYAKMDMKAMAEQMGDQPPPKITATGRTETIVGKECEYYTIEQSGQQAGPAMDVFVAKGMGFFNASSGNAGGVAGLGMAAHAEAWREAFKDGYFPMKMVMNQQGMAIEMVVTKLEEKSVPDSTFDLTVPEGYTEMPIPGMGGRGRGG